MSSRFQNLSGIENDGEFPKKTFTKQQRHVPHFYNKYVERVASNVTFIIQDGSGSSLIFNPTIKQNPAKNSELLIKELPFLISKIVPFLLKKPEMEDVLY